jgi:hypothetical protein
MKKSVNFFKDPAVTLIKVEGNTTKVVNFNLKASTHTYKTFTEGSKCVMEDKYTNDCVLTMHKSYVFLLEKGYSQFVGNIPFARAKQLALQSV